jgi:L-malate glycosyltransferase
MSRHSPRLGVVAPMNGIHHGHVTTQGLILATRFAAEGLPVVATSHAQSRYRRLVDITVDLLRRGREIDVVILAVYGGRSFVVEDLASRISRWHGHRLVMFLHGGAMPAFMARFPRWTRAVLGRADLLIAPSAYLQRAVAAHGFQARVIPNVIDLGCYPFRRRSHVRPRLFWMRTFHPFWNPEMAIRVVRRLKADFPDVSLVMAGQDSGLRAPMIEAARRAGLGDAVRFPGFLDHDHKVHEAQHADIFVNTNHVDNMPVAVVEAAAMGLPVVSTDVGGLPDLLQHERTALLVRDDDDAGMAAQIRRLIEEPALADRLSGNGRQMAEGMAWESVRTKWFEMFDELMTPAARPARGEA